MAKMIKVVFRSGAVVSTPYSYKVYQEMAENLGKDHRLSAKNFECNMKGVEGIFYEVVENTSDVEAE